jgi:hypothetical protein
MVRNEPHGPMEDLGGYDVSSNFGKVGMMINIIPGQSFCHEWAVQALVVPVPRPDPSPLGNAVYEVLWTWSSWMQEESRNNNRYQKALLCQ